jgi:hypothetical protein
MNRIFACLFCLSLLSSACSNSGDVVATDVVETIDAVQVYDIHDLAVPEEVITPVDVYEVDLGDLVPREIEVDVPVRQCQPGDGCFLDGCVENADCLSGFCVEHMGDGVCTSTCDDECPPGWSCQQVGTGPDVAYICVSNMANLCRPCATGADCKSPGGAEDVCVAYGGEGSFCGGNCLDDTDCPWGFTCQAAMTMTGVEILQCVADAGVCPCTGKSVELALSTPCEQANEFGSCEGQRTCTDVGLTVCDAPLPEVETCNGVDDDCDDETDEPSLIDGSYQELCDDGNPCTGDSCEATDGCVNEVLDEGGCDDGDPCTVADHCVAGTCVGDAVECDDFNPCTDNVCTATGGCDYPPVGGECDDEDVCTLGDHCVAGECVGEAVDCDCEVDEDCEVLEDGNLCDGTLICNTASVPFQCEVNPETVVECPPPLGVDVPCQEAVCAPDTGLCSFMADGEGEPCNDGDLCSLGDICVEGVCTAGPATNCNDGNPCTDDLCEPLDGCQHEPNQEFCNDGDACTTLDACLDGTCAGGPALGCDDDNLCTDDSCDPVTGCTHVANSVECSDEDPCTVDDKCSGGACLAGLSLLCEDNNPCTSDVCVSGQGCAYNPLSGACSDGNPCTLNDICKDGECLPGLLLDCDDSNPCTDDVCHPEGGCLSNPAENACNDDNECTLGDHCDDGKCAYDSLAKCDDGNPCTNDLCDPIVGCVTQVNTALCDDADACTTKDTCSLGLCVGGPAPDCNDGNLCTDDSCDSEQGCIYTPNESGCDDGNQCTEDDTCKNGWCNGTVINCDDGNQCTDDSCDPLSGCLHSNNEVPCSDGDFCTTGDMCSVGTCLGGGETPCDDGLFCNGEETCQSDKGCLDGIPLVVDDQIACTVDSCDEENDKVVNDPDDGACPAPGLCEAAECSLVDGCVVNILENCCGNLIIEDPEGCDDGNLDDDDSCIDCLPAECGDGIRWVGEEACDKEDLGPETCADLLGADYVGDVFCNPDCSYNVSLCIGPLGTVSNPAANCKAILDAGDSSGDGVYYLLAGDDTVKAWCDMEGGGWTLVTSWPHELTPGVWGEFSLDLDDPKPGTKHVLPFRSILPHPTEIRMTYVDNAQSLTFALTPGADWQVHDNGARFPLPDGRYLVFAAVHCGPGQGICVVSGAYHTGFTCDGNNGQIAGQGVFQECTYDEFCNCNTYGWKYASGGCSAAVCPADGQLAVYLR